MELESGNDSEHEERKSETEQSIIFLLEKKKKRERVIRETKPEVDTRNFDMIK